MASSKTDRQPDTLPSRVVELGQPVDNEQPAVTEAMVGLRAEAKQREREPLGQAAKGGFMCLTTPP